MTLSAVKHFLTRLPNKQLFVNRCESLRLTFQGNGGGLLSGSLIEKLFCESFDGVEKYNFGENDMKICEIPFSFKKITGKKTALAYKWSKNKREEPIVFKSPMLIFNRKSEKWFTKTPDILAGIYIISLDHLSNVKISENNKTSSKIDAEEIYKLLNLSLRDNLFVSFPKETDEIERFSIKNGFQ